MAPLIACTSSEIKATIRIGERVFPLAGTASPLRTCISDFYLQAIQNAGGIPVLLPHLPQSLAEDALSAFDGLLLTGGVDVTPEHYGKSVHVTMTMKAPEVDAFELQLLQQARTLGLPVLGICRGLQIMNVERGGTLHQHLPELHDLSDTHRSYDSHLPHRVCTQPGSHLEAILGTELVTNSFHHQAIENLGSGLQATAWAEDGIIEGIEDPAHPFYLGVQWHPESDVHTSDVDRRLFREFIAACRMQKL